MSTTTLISIETLKSRYPVDSNTDQLYIKSALLKGDRLLIKPIIGEDLYNNLINYINDVKSGSTRNSNYDILLEDYIEGAVGWYICSEIVWLQAYKLKNKPNENDKYDDTARIAAKFKADSQSYLSQLKDYLVKNNYINNDSDLNLDVVSGIYLGDTSNYDNKKLSIINEKYSNFI